MRSRKRQGVMKVPPSPTARGRRKHPQAVTHELEVGQEGRRTWPGGQPGGSSGGACVSHMEDGLPGCTGTPAPSSASLMLSWVLFRLLEKFLEDLGIQLLILLEL